MEWVVYEVLVGDQVVVRDYDRVDYVERLAKYPVLEAGSPGAEEVLRGYRGGLPVTVRALSQGLTEGWAEAVCRGLATPWVVPVRYYEVVTH